MSEQHRVKIAFRVINCPKWIEKEACAHIIALHTPTVEAVKMASKPLPPCYYHVFDFACNKWAIQYLPDPLLSDTGSQ